MFENKGKRIRAPNFTNVEKVAILNIIMKYEYIIECKKTDSMTWRKKEEAWKKITDEFNTQRPSLIFRSIGSLKKFYENYKKTTRKNATENGVCSKHTFDTTYESVHGLQNHFDGNVSLTSQDSNEVEFKFIDVDHQTQTEPPDVHEDIPKLYISQSTNIDNPLDWEEQESHKRRRTENTVVLNSSYLSKQYSELAEVKLELTKYQLDALKSDTERRRKREDEEFELRKTGLLLDIEIKRAQLAKLTDNNKGVVIN